MLLDMLALSSYKAGAYDLLLLDINMPQMNGFELYQKIRLVDDYAKVCFISAFKEYETEFRELFPDLNEADYFIRKPIELESLTKKSKITPAYGSTVSYLYSFISLLESRIHLLQRT